MGAVATGTRLARSLGQSGPRPRHSLARAPAAPDGRLAKVGPALTEPDRAVKSPGESATRIAARPGSPDAARPGMGICSRRAVTLCTARPASDRAPLYDASPPAPPRWLK